MKKSLLFPVFRRRMLKVKGHEKQNKSPNLSSGLLQFESNFAQWSL